jgi:hypothetical protein
MNAEPINVPEPICEACWIKNNAQWEPQSIDDRGNILMRLRGVPTPPKYETGTVETCSSCGAMTVVGFYNFREPEIIFPNEELF